MNNILKDAYGHDELEVMDYPILKNILEDLPDTVNAGRVYHKLTKAIRIISYEMYSGNDRHNEESLPLDLYTEITPNKLFDTLWKLMDFQDKYNLLKYYSDKAKNYKSNPDRLMRLLEGLNPEAVLPNLSTWLIRFINHTWMIIQDIRFTFWIEGNQFIFMDIGFSNWKESMKLTRYYLNSNYTKYLEVQRSIDRFWKNLSTYDLAFQLFKLNYAVDLKYVEDKTSSPSYSFFEQIKSELYPEEESKDLSVN